MSFALFGLAVSPGIAIGRVQLVSHATLEVSHYTVPARQVEAEMARFDGAIAFVRNELASLKTSAHVGAPSEVGAFVDLHMMILADPLLCDVPRKIIAERRCNAEWALVQEMDELVAQFDQIEDAYLRERKQDIVQVVERVVKALLGKPGRLVVRKDSDEAAIVIAHDLSPADTIDFRQLRIAGFATDLGGATSHTAIVARGMSIPAVVGMHHVRQLVKDEDLVIIDGTRGVVIVDPDKRVLEEFRLRKTELELERNKLKRLKTTRSETLDGEAILLQANIEQPGDVAQAREVDAAGIGLYRTEFLFIGRDELPGEDEQFEAYRSVVQSMRGRPVNIRTLDVGADKGLRGVARIEANPALGLRAIRYCLAEPKLFLMQLRAVLRASNFGPVRLLIPMLAHAHEIDQALAMIEMAKKQLRESRLRFNDDIEVGGMIEIPAAALSLGVFVKRLDFLSIGTNDLIQYTLAIDRTDEAVAHLYDPTHPSVLRLIQQTIQTGTRAGLPVAVCGEMAGNPDYTRLLIGMGLRQFSMHPAQILEVKQEVLRSDAAELGAKVARALRFDEPDRLREALEKL
ncbi:MAG: phosphoenolpyruvate--protein phosphotransferase [Sterolibacteriaceae bacterium]|uniref:Phosphoenolpyruvate-protein phosphotransferase n=1 Tax=Candidatus Methylophosphatis roskildensis TaxID=2899263 RepID=A0A9D7E198_9PROT|nr:phosphoenolpyruvate--protein phosphotransferase [Candidatus Methylophosphatis roskildensis]MBK7235208.1 phosphoenolpyruvate--protein phosphotransferase [Sterolibacteriaceae bacterium]